ncbi:hypothetical protein, partial [Megamonas funiformis]|uniref:hypothetical protein n=1 Tax=Megamonas funiformis TaxID=437897 RepID=UPI003F80B3CA
PKLDVCRHQVYNKVILQVEDKLFLRERQLVVFGYDVFACSFISFTGIKLFSEFKTEFKTVFFVVK